LCVYLLGFLFRRGGVTMKTTTALLAVLLVGGLSLAGAAGRIYQTQAADQPKGLGRPPVAENDQEVGKGRATPKEEPAPINAKQEQKVLTPDEAIELRPKEAVTVQFKVTAVQDESQPPKGFGVGFVLLKDGGRFSVRLVPPVMHTIKRLEIEPVKHFTGRVVRVTGHVQSDPTGSSFHIKVEDLNQSQFTFVGLDVGPSTQQPEVKPDENAALERKVLTPEEAIKQLPKENVTVQFKVASVEAMPNPGTGFGGPVYYIFLHDGGRFTARLAKAADQFMKLGIEPVEHFTGKVVRVTGRIEPDAGNLSFQMWVRDLADLEVEKK
jgi:DNA/RNA endonuclease YhcR with UshA esterase domain